MAPLACASRDDGALRARAARDGTVRVIVTLAVAGAQLPAEAATRDAQERLIGALTAGPDALDVLFASPLVAAVQPDSLSKPMSPGAR